MPRAVGLPEGQAAPVCIERVQNDPKACISRPVPWNIQSINNQHRGITPFRPPMSSPPIIPYKPHASWARSKGIPRAGHHQPHQGFPLVALGRAGGWNCLRLKLLP